MITNIIAVVANVALALSVVVALIFGIAQIKVAERDRRERFTLDTLSAFQTREFAELIQYSISRKAPSNQAELNKMSIEDQVMFIELSQKMESLGIMVAEGFINLDLVDKTLGSFVLTLWRRVEPFVREVRENPKAPDPYLNEYFQWLAERIDERMSGDNQRKPFYETEAR